MKRTKEFIWTHGFELDEDVVGVIQNTCKERRSRTGFAHYENQK